MEREVHFAPQFSLSVSTAFAFLISRSMEVLDSSSAQKSCQAPILSSTLLTPASNIRKCLDSFSLYPTHPEMSPGITVSPSDEQPPTSAPRLPVSRN